MPKLKLAHLFLMLLTGFCLLSLTGCEEDNVVDPGLYGLHDSFTYRSKGGLQVGYIDNGAYFNQTYKLPYVPNIIVTARGDVADLYIEGFIASDNSCEMSSVSIADLKMVPSAEGTFLNEMRGFTTLSGSLSINGEAQSIRQIKLGDFKVTTNRIAITELRIIFGNSGLDCVRLTDITGVVVREK